MNMNYFTKLILVITIIFIIGSGSIANAFDNPYHVQKKGMALNTVYYDNGIIVVYTGSRRSSRFSKSQRRRYFRGFKHGHRYNRGYYGYNKGYYGYPRYFKRYRNRYNGYYNRGYYNYRRYDFPYKR